MHKGGFDYVVRRRADQRGCHLAQARVRQEVAARKRTTAVTV